MTDLNIIYRTPESLVPDPRNSRTHSQRQIEQIARSIERFGFNNPVLLNGDSKIVGGHDRVAAAKLLKLDRVPTVQLAHLTPEQLRAYNRPRDHRSGLIGSALLRPTAGASIVS